MSAPLPLGLRNPYDHEKTGYGHPCPHCVFEKGARAAIARLREMLGGDTGELRDVEHELKGET